jgi:hypothetical protein
VARAEDRRRRDRESHERASPHLVGCEDEPGIGAPRLQGQIGAGGRRLWLLPRTVRIPHVPHERRRSWQGARPAIILGPPKPPPRRTPPPVPMSTVLRAGVTLTAGLLSFAAAWLLFISQPVLARLLLPEMGGGPAVWTTLLMCFQALLVGGYLYAHLSAARLSPRTQALVHGLALLLAGALSAMGGWAPWDGAGSPLGWVVLVCMGGIGPAFLVIAGSSPILHRIAGSAGIANRS